MKNLMESLSKIFSKKTDNDEHWAVLEKAEISEEMQDFSQKCIKSFAEKIQKSHVKIFRMSRGSDYTHSLFSYAKERIMESPEIFYSFRPSTNSLSQEQKEIFASTLENMCQNQKIAIDTFIDLTLCYDNKFKSPNKALLVKIISDNIQGWLPLTSDLGDHHLGYTANNYGVHILRVIPNANGWFECCNVMQEFISTIAFVSSINRKFDLGLYCGVRPFGNCRETYYAPFNLQKNKK